MQHAKKIRVLECIRQGEVGGGESHLLSLSTHLHKDQFEPVVLSFTDGPMIDLLKKKGIQTHVIYTKKPFDLFVWRKVKKLIRDEKIDIVHAHGSRASSNVFWAARSLHIPLVYTIHGWSFHNDQHPFRKKLRILGEKFLVSRSDVNISVSESNRLTGKKYIPSFTSTVVNNGVEPEKFNPSRDFKNIRQELSIEPDTILLLFIARFTHHKQPLTLIRAFAEARKINPRIKLLMVGDGDQKNAALALAGELAVEKEIIFLPFRQDVPDILHAADIFILPSLWEGLSIGCLEAMSMGKAIIASRVDGTIELIQHQHNGYLVEINKLTEQLTEAIILLSADPVLRKKYGINAMETVKRDFAVTDMTRKIETIYSRLYQ